MMPDAIQARLRDVLELNPTATTQQLRVVLVNRVRYLMGSAEIKNYKYLDSFQEVSPGDHPGGALAGEPQGGDGGGWDTGDGTWDVDSFGHAQTGKAEGKGTKGKTCDGATPTVGNGRS